jgi:hypothetical protein
MRAIGFGTVKELLRRVENRPVTAFYVNLATVTHPGQLQLQTADLLLTVGLEYEDVAYWRYSIELGPAVTHESEEYRRRSALAKSLEFALRVYLGRRDKAPIYDGLYTFPKDWMTMIGGIDFADFDKETRTFRVTEEP